MARNPLLPKRILCLAFQFEFDQMVTAARSNRRAGIAVSWTLGCELGVPGVATWTVPALCQRASVEGPIWSSSPTMTNHSLTVTRVTSIL